MDAGIPRRLLTLAVILCAGARLASAQSSAMRPDQWSILAAADVRPGTQFGLHNNYVEKSLRFQRRDTGFNRDKGINLGWDDSNADRSIRFERAGTGNSPIGYGERIAVRIGNEGYLRYRERDHGINLVWSASPVYEWEITGGRPGEPVTYTPSIPAPRSSRVRLYNAAHGDYLLYGVRSEGINLRWYADEMAATGHLPRSPQLKSGYPPLPFPPQMRSPSGETGQIMVGGIVSNVAIFHGGNDEELDWHLYITLDPQTRSRLFRHLLDHGVGAKTAHYVGGAHLPLREDDLDRVYAEWMVLDGYRSSLRDDKYFSADVTRALGLRRSAWDYSADAAKKQGLTGATVTPNDSRLVSEGALVFLQGQFVNDKAHGFLVEIHPLDSFAYALNACGTPIGVRASDAEWPADTVTWRVAVFTNSNFHRINRSGYVNKQRTTTWYLPLPGNANRPGFAPAVGVDYPLVENHPMRANVSLDGRRTTAGAMYSQYRVVGNSYRIERDPSDGVTKLRVTVEMDTPDKYGGMFLAEYRVTAVRR